MGNAPGFQVSDTLRNPARRGRTLRAMWRLTAHDGKCRAIGYRYCLKATQRPPSVKATMASAMMAASVFQFMGVSSLKCAV
jgi:hypothetical protein